MVVTGDIKMLWKEIATDLERRNACRIGLQCQCDQFVKQGQIFDGIAIGWLVEWSRWFRLIRPATPQVQPLLHVANRCKVFIEFNLVFLIDTLSQPIGFLPDRIENRRLDLILCMRRA